MAKQRCCFAAPQSGAAERFAAFRHHVIIITDWVVLILKHGFMKRFLICALALALFLPVKAHAAAEFSAEALILYEPRTGTVLREKKADEPMLIASTTKIMTALLVVEHCAMQETVTVTEAMCGAEGSSLYLSEGQQFTVEELLYGLMLASANDAAEALAIHAAGSIEAFAAMMNEKAAILGMANTHYANPHGLDDPAGQHYSCARDLALLTAAAMENPLFCRFFSAREFDIHGTVIENHNKLLASYDGCLGGKTGYTRAAGRTLVSVAERDGLRLICVTLSDPDDWNDHRALFDAAFADYRFLTFPEAGWKSVPAISSTASSVPLRCSVPYALVRKGREAQVHVFLPRFVFAPVRRDDKLGSLVVAVRGKAVVRADILAAADAPTDPAQRLRPWERLIRFGDRYIPAGRNETILFQA